MRKYGKLIQKLRARLKLATAEKEESKLKKVIFSSNEKKRLSSNVANDKERKTDRKKAFDSNSLRCRDDNKGKIIHIEYNFVQKCNVQDNFISYCNIFLG